MNIARALPLLHNASTLLFVPLSLLLIGTGLAPAAAEKDLQTVLELQLKPYDAYICDPEEIIEQCTDALAKNEKLSNADLFQLYLRRGFAYGYLRRYEDAVSDLNEAIKLRPQDAQALHFRATTMALMGKREQAVKELKELIALHPGFADAYVSLANQYHWAEDHQKCLENADKAIKLDPKDPDAYYFRAIGHLGLNNFSNALRDLNECVARGSFGQSRNVAFPYIYRAYINFEVFGNLTDARRDLILATHLDPDSIQARVDLWSYYFKTGKFLLADKVSKRLTERFPGNAPILECRVSSLISQNLLEETLETADQAVRLGADDKTSNCFLARGNAYFAMGRYGDSLRDYEKGCWLRQGDPLPMASKAYLLAACPDEKLRDGATAIKLASECCKKTGMQNPRFLMLLAMAHAECGQFQAAIQVANKALEKAYPDFPWLEEYKKRLKLFEQRKPYRFSPDPKVFDYVY